MSEIFFSVPDWAIVTWLGIGVCITAVVDGFARDAGVTPLSWKEWTLASITWPVSLVNIGRVLLS